MALPESERIEAEKGKQAAANQRRAAVFNSGSPGRLPKTITLPIPEKESGCIDPPSTTEEVNTQDNYTRNAKNFNRVEIYPNVILGATNKRKGKTGAIRVYFIARHIDLNHRGMIDRQTLLDYIVNELKVAKKTTRRWIGAAVKMGLLKPRDLKKGERIYEIPKLGKAAVIMGNIADVGSRAEIPVKKLVKTRGWRAGVWGGYLSTLKPRPKQVLEKNPKTGEKELKTKYPVQRPISQRAKKKITGVTPWQQAYYEKQIKPKRRYNYTDRGRGDIEIAQELTQENGGFYYATKQGEIRQKLPMILTVSKRQARNTGKGIGAKKANDYIRDTSYFVRGQDEYNVRLFHDELYTAEKTIQNILKNGDVREAQEVFIIYPRDRTKPKTREWTARAVY